MPFNPDRHRRRSPRLPGYDYARPGTYFVTVCIHGRICLLGDVVEKAIRLSEAGKMVLQTWREMPEHYPGVSIDAVVVMPNHFHGIVVLRTTPDGQPPMPLPDVMQRFKSLTTARYRHGVMESGWPAFEGRLWHRSYYDHIIRDRADLARLRSYIAANPARWVEDQLHPSRKPADPHTAP